LGDCSERIIHISASSLCSNARHRSRAGRSEEANFGPSIPRLVLQVTTGLLILPLTPSTTTPTHESKTNMVSPTSYTGRDGVFQALPRLRI
jgi:hypothetical protein